MGILLENRIYTVDIYGTIESHISGELPYPQDTVSFTDSLGVVLEPFNTCIDSIYHLKMFYIGKESGVDTIGGFSFYECGNLEEIHCDSIELFGTFCFSYCNSLKYIYAPKLKAISGQYNFLQLPNFTLDFGENAVNPPSIEYANSFSSFGRGAITLKFPNNGFETKLRNSPIWGSLINQGIFKFEYYDTKHFDVYSINDVKNDVKYDDLANNELAYVNSSNKVQHPFSSMSELSSFNTVKRVIDTENDIMAVKDYGFNNCTNFVSISSNSISSVGIKSFYNCRSLTTANMSSVGSIGDESFEGCFSIESIPFSDSLTSVGASAFYDCRKLSNGAFPLLKSIGSFSFASCSSMENFSSPNITDIPDGAFSKCTALSGFSSEGVTSIGNESFSECRGMSSVDFQNVVSIGESSFANCSNLKSAEFQSAMSVGSRSFEYCQNLSSISFPSVVSVGNGAFYYCNGLTSVSLPSAASIGESSFNSCQKLSYAESATVTSIGNEVFSNCKKLTSASLPAVVSIGYEAFKSCEELSSVSFPSLTSVIDAAFNGCSSLKSVNLPSVRHIGNTSFSSCKNLTSSSFPSVTSVGLLSFSNCEGIETIYLPSVISIGDYSFNRCKKLKTVDFGDTISSIPSVSRTSFDGITNIVKCRIPDDDDLYASWTSDSNWKYLIENDIVQVERRIPNRYITMTSTSNKQTRVDFDKIASTKMSYVKNVSPYVETNYPYSEYASISSKTNLSEATDGMSLMDAITSYSFYSCQNLSSVSFPSVQTVGESALCDCGKLVFASFPSATEIGRYSLRYCKNLSNVNLQSAVSIGHCSFGNCSSLETVSLPSVTSIDSITFEYCKRLSSVYVPSLVSIGYGAFSYCENLSSISLPNVETIGSNAFFNCIGLSGIDFGLDIENAPELSNANVFEGCRNGIICRIPNNPTIIQQFRSGNWGNLVNSGKIVLTVNDAIKTVSINGTYRPIYKDDIKTEILAYIDSDGNVIPPYSSIDSISSFNTLSELYDTCDSFTSVGYGAFRQCTNVASVSSDSVSSIGDDAFYGCTGIKSVKFKNAAGIGLNAFYGCVALSSADFPDITEIGENAFYGCRGISSAAFSGIAEITNSSFTGCVNLTSAKFQSAKIIGRNTFSDCSSLSSSNFEYVTSIGERAFYNCSGLKDVSLNDCVSISDSAFLSSGLSKDLSFASLKTIGNDTFSYCGNIKSITAMEAVSVGKRAFSSCTSLSCVSIPRINSISEGTFNGCSSLLSVKFENVTSIGDESFSNCTSLSSASISSVERIGARAFSKCSALSSIKLGNVKSIGNEAFTYCTALTSIDFGGITEVPDIGSNVFDFSSGKIVTCMLPLNEKLYDRWKNDAKWRFYVDTKKVILKFPEYLMVESADRDSVKVFVEEFGENRSLCYVNKSKKVLSPFSNHSEISSFDSISTIDDRFSAFTSISSYSFNYCTELESISSTNVTSIGEKAFENCTGLTSISFDKVKTVGDYAFKDCKYVETAYFASVTSLGEGSFYGCKKIENFDSNTVLELGDNSFERCSQLKSLDIPNVTAIGDGTFSYCTNLESIDFGKTMNYVPSIGEGVFTSVTKTVSCYIPDNNQLAKKWAREENWKDYIENGKVVILQGDYVEIGNSTIPKWPKRCNDVTGTYKNCKNMKYAWTSDSEELMPEAIANHGNAVFGTGDSLAALFDVDWGGTSNVFYDIKFRYEKDAGGNLIPPSSDWENPQRIKRGKNAIPPPNISYYDTSKYDPDLYLYDWDGRWQNVNGSTDVYRKYIRKTHDVCFYDTYDNPPSLIQKKTVNRKTQVEIPTNPNRGEDVKYTSWTLSPYHGAAVSGDPIPLSSDGNTTVFTDVVTSDFNAYVHYYIDTYRTVTFKWLVGDDVEEQDTRTVESTRTIDDTPTVGEFSRIGHRFTGWNDSDGNKVDFSTKSITSNFTVSAAYDKLEYTITFVGGYDNKEVTHINVPFKEDISRVPELYGNYYPDIAYYGWDDSSKYTCVTQPATAYSLYRKADMENYMNIPTYLSSFAVSGTVVDSVASETESIQVTSITLKTAGKDYTISDAETGYNDFGFKFNKNTYENLTDNISVEIRDEKNLSYTLTADVLMNRNRINAYIGKNYNWFRNAVRTKIGDEEFSYNVDIHGNYSPHMPNPDTEKYLGAMESCTGWHVSNSYTTMTVEFSGFDEFSVYAKNCGESINPRFGQYNFDGPYFSNLNMRFASKPATSSPEVYTYISTNSLSSDTALTSYSKITYTDLDNSENYFIDISYVKDGSMDVSTDRAYILFDCPETPTPIPTEESKINVKFYAEDYIPKS